MAKKAAKAAAPKKAAAKKSTAKKPRNAKSAAAEKEAAAPPPPKLEQNAFKAPSKDYLKRFVKRLENLGTTAAEASGEISGAIQAAHEQKGVDKIALSIVRRLDSLSLQKLQVTLPHLFLYIEHLELEKKAETQGQLELEKDGEEDDDDMGDGRTGEQLDIETEARKASGPIMSIVPKPNETAADVA